MISNGLKQNEIQLDDIIQIIKINIKKDNEIIECCSIEDLNDILKEIGVSLSDIKLSCLCCKYSLPNELIFLDIKKFKEDFI